MRREMTKCIDDEWNQRTLCLRGILHWSLQCQAERWFGMDIGGDSIPEGWMVGGVEKEIMITFQTDGKWEG